MGVAYKDIINYFIANNITYRVIESSNLNPQRVYRFASLKNIIPFGFYFIEQNYIHLKHEISNSIIITNAESVQDEENTYIIVDSPQLVHYKLAALNSDDKLSGIHKTAIVSPNANISEKAYVGPYCIIEDCIIEEGVQLLGHVTVRNNTIIKRNTIIEGNSVIGARGMAWIWNKNGERIIQPQTGGVIIESDCILGTDITIVRGSLNENTLIGKHTIIAHGTKIGHGSIVGNYVHIANNVSLAGNANIGERTFLGSASTISSNVAVAANCIVGAGAVVSKSFEQEYATLVGIPAKIIKTDNFKEKPKGAPKPFK